MHAWNAFVRSTRRISVRLQEFLGKSEKVLGCTYADNVQEVNQLLLIASIVHFLK